MTDCHLFDIGENCPDVVTAMTEIPLGSPAKYEYDKKRGVFELDQNSLSLELYPADYGLIPQPIRDNGDSLDLLAPGERRTFLGCLDDASAICLFRMVKVGKPDKRYVTFKRISVQVMEPT